MAAVYQGYCNACNFPYTRGMYRYTLQSGIRLSTHQLIDAVVEAADFPHCYLDLDTGVLITVNSSEMLAIWKRSVGALAMKRYLKLAPFTPKEQDELSREFITTVIALIAPKKVDLAQQAAQEGGWEAVEALLETFMPELLEGWYDHLDMHGGVRVHELLMNQDYAAIESELRGCGDCAACKLEQGGDVLNEEKLTELETEEIMQHVARQLDLRRQNNE